MSFVVKCIFMFDEKNSFWVIILLIEIYFGLKFIFSEIKNIFLGKFRGERVARALRLYRVIYHTRRTVGVGQSLVSKSVRLSWPFFFFFFLTFILLCFIVAKVSCSSNQLANIPEAQFFRPLSFRNLKKKSSFFVYKYVTENYLWFWKRLTKFL